ncbi:dynein axonemal intermediate chain 7-like [Lycorma delicatula]|uniref:dynein axonemal intermediate chain 7-like n=1 Tax=Lycorma delicatula TaxID=130591 RepID=UPI003F5167C6
MVKKKLSKRELERIAEAEAKKKQQEEEAERQRLRKEEKERMKKEQARAREKAQKEANEHENRIQTLSKSCALFNEMKEKKLQKDIKSREEEDWILYLKCDGKPNPGNLGEMNTYLYLWQLENDSDYIDNTIIRCTEVLKLLDVSDNLINNPLNASENLVKNWKEVRQNFRTELQTRIDNATFSILRNLEQNMISIDLSTVHYLKECPHFILGLWTEIINPHPWNYEPVAPTVDFSQIGVSLQVPYQLAKEYYVIRVLWVKYNHYSDISMTWNSKPLLPEYNRDLFTLNFEEYEQKQQLKKMIEEELRIQREREKSKRKKRHTKTTTEPEVMAQNETTTKPTTEPLPVETESGLKEIPEQERKEKESKEKTEITDNTEVITPVTATVNLQRSPSEILLENEENLKTILKEYLKTEVKEKEINMRQRIVLGGVFHINLLEQPSQPKILPDRTILTIIHGEPKIRHLDYYEVYVPPPPKEEEDKPLHSTDEPEAEKKPEEDSLNRLTLINITLPDTVLWFDTPIAVQWRDDINQWTTEYIYDSRFNEEKQVITFRVGKMAPIGLSTARFINLPYQAWEMRPDWKGGPGGVFFSITAATIIIEFIIRNNKVCINSLQNASGNALQDLVGLYFEPNRLIRMLQKGGVDVFPEHDAFIYTEGITPKHWITENHIYQCMALLSTTYNFSWSRWNLLAGQKKIVMQIREFLDRKRLPNYSMLLVTPQRTIVVDCTEVSQAFSEQGIQGMEYYPDLYWLTQAHASSTSKEKIEKADLMLVQTVNLILTRTRVFSFS